MKNNKDLKEMEADIKAYLSAKKIVADFERAEAIKKITCKHRWKYLSGSPHNKLHECLKCGAVG